MEEKKQKKVEEETKKQTKAEETAEEAKDVKEEQPKAKKAEEKKSSWKKTAMIVAGGAAVGALIANDTSRGFIVDTAKSVGSAIGSGCKSLWGKIRGKKEEPAAVEAEEQPQQIGFTSLEESPVTIERRDWREPAREQQRERMEPQQVAAEATQNQTRQQQFNNRPRFEREGGKKFN